MKQVVFKGTHISLPPTFRALSGSFEIEYTFDLPRDGYEVDKENQGDWYFRMLKIIELQLGMAFPVEYILTGNGKEKVKQLGNAVTPPPMEWIIGQVMKVL